MRRGIIDDPATFLTGERRSTLNTWVPIATGEKIPIARGCERYSDDPDDWSRVLISNQDLSVEAAAAR